MASFVQTGRRTKNIVEFLKGVANSENSIKYKPERGKKHFVYVVGTPVTTTDENGNETTSYDAIALTADVHDWTDGDGYKSTVCLHDIVRTAEDGTILNTGSCPICENIRKSWDIYKYRMAEAENNCSLTGEEREKFLESCKHQFVSERKAKEAKSYIYILVALFRTDNTGEPIIDKSTGLPEYELKVMKLSSVRAEKIQTQLENSGVDFVGSEIVFEYPDKDDIRLVVSQSTTAPVFSKRMITQRYPEVLNKINETASKFTWEGIEKSFPEWNGMTNAQADSLMEKYFSKWDNYIKELEVNPNAKYLEGTTSVAPSTPALETTKDTEGVPDVNEIFSGLNI